MNKNPYYLKLMGFTGNISIATPILPLYLLDNGVSLAAFLLGQAVYSITAIAAEVPTGVMADRIGHRKSVILGSVFALLVAIMYLVMPNVYGFYIAMVFAGLSESLYSGSNEALLFDSLKTTDRNSYKKQFAHVLSNGTLAFSIGTAIVGLSLGLWNSSIYFTLLVIAAIIKAVNVAVSLKLVDPDSHEQLNPADSKMWQTFKDSMSVVSKDSTLKNLTYSKVLTLTAQYVMFGVYAAYFLEGGVSAYWIGFALTLGSLLNGLLMRYVHLLERYLALDKVILYFNLAMAATYLAFATVSSPVLLVALFVLLQGQFNLQNPIVSDYINERVDSNIRATVLSGISLIRQIGNVTSKVLLGLAVAGVGITGMIKIQAAYMFFGSLITFWLLRRCGCVYKLGDPRLDTAK